VAALKIDDMNGISHQKHLSTVLTCTEFKYSGYIGEQTLAEGDNDSNNFAGKLITTKSGSFHAEMNEHDPSLKEADPIMPGR